MRKNWSRGKQWLSICVKRWRISSIWDVLFFLFNDILYNTNWPLLYSLTNVVPLKHTELDFNLPITVSDFCCSIKQTQHTDASSHSEKSSQSFLSTPIHLPVPFSCPSWSSQFHEDSVGERSSGLSAVLSQESGLTFQGQKWKESQLPISSANSILVSFLEGGRVVARPGYLCWSIWMHAIGNAISIRKTCRQTRSEMHFLWSVWL